MGPPKGVEALLCPSTLHLSPEKMLFGFALSGHMKNSHLWPSVEAGVNYFFLPSNSRRPMNSVQDLLQHREEDTQPSGEMHSVRMIWCELCKYHSSRVTVPGSQTSNSLPGKRLGHCLFLRLLAQVTVSLPLPSTSPLTNAASQLPHCLLRSFIKLLRQN